jgi:hypothetical protein
MSMTKSTIIASAHRGANFALAAELVSNPTVALTGEAIRLTSPTRAKKVRAHEFLCAALAVTAAAAPKPTTKKVVARASEPMNATKSDQIREAARAAAPAGKKLRTANIASRIAANNPRWGVKRVTAAALAEVAPSWSNSDWAHLDINA